MQGKLQALIAQLQGTRDAVQASLQAFPPLDLQQVSAKLNVEARSTESGRANRPSTDAASPDLLELDVLSEIEQRATRAGGEYRSVTELREGRIRRALINADTAVEIEAAGQGAVSDLAALARLHL